MISGFCEIKGLKIYNIYNLEEALLNHFKVLKINLLSTFWFIFMLLFKIEWSLIWKSQIQPN